MKRRLAFALPAVTFATIAVTSQTAQTPTARTADDLIASCERLVRSQAAGRADPSAEYSLDIRGEGGTRSVYFGISSHTFDPDDPQYAAMQTAWRELRPTDGYFEGTGNFIGETLTASLKQSGEPGLVRFLARQDHIPARSLEPTAEDVASALLAKFTPEQVALWDITRDIAALRDRRKLAGTALTTLIAEQIAARRAPQISGAFADVTAYRAAYARWFPGMDPAEAPASWFDPIHTSAETGSRFLNDAHAASSLFRDVHAYRTLAHAWRPGARIFAEIGRDHIPAESAALRCALRFP